MHEFMQVRAFHTRRLATRALSPNRRWRSSSSCSPSTPGPPSLRREFSTACDPVFDIGRFAFSFFARLPPCSFAHPSHGWRGHVRLFLVSRSPVECVNQKWFAPFAWRPFQAERLTPPAMRRTTVRSRPNCEFCSDHGWRWHWIASSMPHPSG